MKSMVLLIDTNVLLNYLTNRDAMGLRYNRDTEEKA